MKLRILLALTIAAGALTAACGGPPSDCVSSDVDHRMVLQQVTDPSVTLLKSASLKRDGGQYVAGRFSARDGSSLTAVWYITDNGAGVVTRVGSVTALISGGADSQKVGISAGSKGFSEVQDCVK